MLQNEQDPLLWQGNKNIENYEANKDLRGFSKSQTAVQGSLMGVVPIFVFTIDLVSMFYLFYNHIFWAGLIFFGMIVGAVVFIVVSDVKKRWLHWLGMLCILASIFGTVVGFYNHYKNMIYYYTYGDLRKYTNVAGSQSSTQFGDAGMLMFTGDTMVDTTRAVGFKNAAEGGTVYCVAPVMDSSMGQTTPVSFWAVGTNCCEPRAHFACDDAGSGAKSAMIMLEKDFLVPPTMEWVLGGLSSRAGFDKAIELEQATFGTIAAHVTALIRWTKDPVALQDEYKHRGAKVVAEAIAVYSLINIVLGAVIAASLVPKKPSKPVSGGSGAEEEQQSARGKRQVPEQP